jgi:23S rRNA pseudouridine2605 synthase/16S rRNA pseudouridine516 synthase
MSNRKTTTPKPKTTATIPDRAGGIRLHKVLADAGVASRRAAEALIAEGRVRVNGRVVTTQGVRVEPGRDTIAVDGRRIHEAGQRVYLLLFKPRGYITSVTDPQGRPTVMDLLRGVRERVFPVGRLDWDSEGLLLLTNDGDLAFRLTHPGNHVPRTYRVKVKGRLPGEALEQARRGIRIDGRLTLPARITPISSQVNSWIEVVLHEGRKNQIRRMFERLGHPVLKLRRVAIGPVQDRRLRPGSWRPLTRGEVDRLREAS